MTWMTRQEAADYLRISVRQLNRLGLPRTMIGRVPRYSRDTLDHYMTEGQWAPPSRRGATRAPLPKFVRQGGDHLMQLKAAQRRHSRRARAS